MRLVNRVSMLRGDLGLLAVIAAVSLIGGFLLNLRPGAGVPFPYMAKGQRLAVEVAAIPGELAPGSPAQPVEFIEFAEVRSASTTALFIDARPSLFFRTGHIPGARNLARDRFREMFLAQRAELETAREKPVIVYCGNAQCEDSILVAGALRDLGFSNVRVFKGGWAEWTREKMPEEQA